MNFITGATQHDAVMCLADSVFLICIHSDTYIYYYILVNTIRAILLRSLKFPFEFVRPLLVMALVILFISHQSSQIFIKSASHWPKRGQSTSSHRWFSLGLVRSFIYSRSCHFSYHLDKTLKVSETSNVSFAFRFCVQLPEKGRAKILFTSFKGTFVFSGNDSPFSGYYMFLPNIISNKRASFIEGSRASDQSLRTFLVSTDPLGLVWVHYIRQLAIPRRSMAVRHLRLECSRSIRL